MLAAISSTACSKAGALWAAGARNPLIFLTYCSAAARTSSSVTSSAYGGRRVLIERHIQAAYAGRMSLDAPSARPMAKAPPYRARTAIVSGCGVESCGVSKEA